jgi:hypothetical protein
MDNLFEPSAIVPLIIGVLIAGIQMVVHNRLEKWIGYSLIAISALLASLGTYRYFTGPTLVVSLSGKQKTDLGRPYTYKPLVDQSVYQGLYENGFVLWIDGRFFELYPEHQHWQLFPDAFPTSDPRWFNRSTLRTAFPRCGERLPIGGLAKSMLGPEKQYYAWLGCLQSETSASITQDVKLQQFSNGWVAEGILNPPQSSYRNRIVLYSDGRWESELMDARGKFTEISPNK